jgi:large subunit ribosomal protein L13
MIIVDGKGAIFGRMASLIAKAVLNGEEVHLINAEEMVLSGDPRFIGEKFYLRRGAQHKGTPEHSPKWPRVPHFLVKRMIRGMLPFKEARGKAAFHRLRVYSGNPNNLSAGSNFEKTSPRRGSKFCRVLDLCRMMGYSG